MHQQELFLCVTFCFIYAAYNYFRVGEESYKISK